MTETATRNRLLPALVYAALATAIVSSLGMLLVPAVARDMDVPVATAQWMLTVNLLVGAIATPVMGRLADGPHRKCLLLVALWIILAGSIVAAVAPNFTIFLVGRALQGLTYGIVPVTIALARRHLPSDVAHFGIASLSVTVSTGIGIGYPLTGVIAGLFDYRFAFWFAVLFVATTLVVVGRTVPDGPGGAAERTPFDLAGALLLGGGLALLLLGIGEGPHWPAGWTAGVFAGAAALLACWVLTELRRRHPLVDLRSLGNTEVLLANATALGLGVVMYMFLSVVSLIAQAPEATGYGAALPLFWAGFVMLPFSVGSFGANRTARVLTRRVDSRALLPIGAGMLTAASMLLWAVHTELWGVVLGMLLFGVGIGFTYAAMPTLIARSVPGRDVGSAIGFNQVLRTIGGSFGTAVVGALLAVRVAPDGHATEAGIGLTLGLAAVGCAVVLAALLAHWAGSRRRAA